MAQYWPFKTPRLRHGGSDNDRANALFRELIPVYEAQLRTNPTWFGAKFDLRVVTDAAMTAGSAVLTSATADFSPFDVGKCVLVKGAGHIGTAHRAKILTYVNSTTVTLDTAALVTASDCKTNIATDDTRAFIACWQYCLTAGVPMSLGKGTIYIGRPEDYAMNGFDDAGADAFLTTGTFVGEATTGIVGLHKWASKIYYDDPIRPVGDAGTFNLPFFKGRNAEGYGSAVVTKVAFRNFSIIGSLDMHGDGNDGTSDPDTNRAYTSFGSALFFGKACDFVEIKDCHFQYIRRQVSWWQQCRHVEMCGNTLWRNAAGGLLAAGCSHTTISDNEIYFGSDDSILVGSREANDMSDEDAPLGLMQFNVHNNRIFGAPGIKASGPIAGNISGNVVVFGVRHGVQVAGYNISEDDAQTNAAGVIVQGNTFINMLDREQLDLEGEGGVAIWLLATSAHTGSGSYVPGDSNDDTGLVDFYPYVSNYQDDANEPLGPMFNLMVKDNIVARLVDPVTNWSDYGFTFWDHGDLTWDWKFQSDEEINEAALRPYGIVLDGDRARNVVIEGNIVSGVGYGLQIKDGSTTLGMTETIVRHNVFWDVGIGLHVNGLDTGINNILIEGNVFDIDPLFNNENHNANGSWGSTNALPAINDGGARVVGLIFKDNVFRNCSTIAKSYGTYVFVNNIVEAQYAAVGFSSSNLGIGTIPAPGGDEWIFRYVGSDSTDAATYQMVLGDALRTSTAMPTSGYYLPGHIVWKASPSASDGLIELGWMRLTAPDDSNHTEDTDWEPIYAVTNDQIASLALTARTAPLSALADDTVRTVEASNGSVITIISNNSSYYFRGLITNNAVTELDSIATWATHASTTLTDGTSDGTDGQMNVAVSGTTVTIKNRTNASRNFKVLVDG